MMGECEYDGYRAPLYGVSGLLGLTMMLLLLASVPEVRWFCLFSIPMGLFMFVIIRGWYHFVDRRSRQLIWIRGGPHFPWPHPIR